MKIFVAGCALLIICIVLWAGWLIKNEEQAESIILHDIKQNFEELNKLCMKDGYAKERDEIRLASINLDHIIKTLIYDRISQGNSLEDIIKMSSSVLHFKAIPQNITTVKYIESYLSAGDKPVVLYRIYESSRGDKLYIFYAALLGGNKYRRILPSIYTVQKRKNVWHVTSVWEESYFLLQPPPTFLDFKRNTTGSTDLVFLNGPSGSGEYISVFQCSYDEGKDLWVNTYLLSDNEISKVVDYSYDEDENMLTYFMLDRDEETNQLIKRQGAFHIPRIQLPSAPLARGVNPPVRIPLPAWRSPAFSADGG